jgi:hypothetical protein
MDGMLEFPSVQRSIFGPLPDVPVVCLFFCLSFSGRNERLKAPSKTMRPPDTGIGARLQQRFIHQVWM